MRRRGRGATRSGRCRDTGSWARLHLRPSGTHLVNQYGPRDLWDEVTAAHGWWYRRDCPGAASWRFTITPDGTRIEPDRDVPAAA